MIISEIYADAAPNPDENFTDQRCRRRRQRCPQGASGAPSSRRRRARNEFIVNEAEVSGDDDDVDDVDDDDAD